MYACCYLRKNAGHSPGTIPINLFQNAMNNHLSIPAALLTLVVATQSATAADHRSLMKAYKYADAEKAAAAVLAREPGNTEAMVARTEAILGGGQASRIEEAVTQAQKCVAVQAASAPCQLALGKALGSKAINSGMMAAMRYAGDIRGAFAKAVELEPRNLDARFSLLQFYLMAPGIAGGGVGKAETLTAQTASVHPEAGKLMQGQIDLKADNLAKAEAAAVGARPGTDQDLIERQENLLVSIGFRHMNQKRYADAERVFADALKRFPDSADILYGQARVQQEQGRHREALALLDKVMALRERPFVHYRIGKSLQGLGDKPKATAAFEKSLSYKDDLPESLQDDARAQLKTLKG